MTGHGTGHGQQVPAAGIASNGPWFVSWHVGLHKDDWGVVQLWHRQGERMELLNQETLKGASQPEKAEAWDRLLDRELEKMRLRSWEPELEELTMRDSFGRKLGSLRQIAKRQACPSCAAELTWDEKVVLESETFILIHLWCPCGFEWRNR